MKANSEKLYCGREGICREKSNVESEKENENNQYWGEKEFFFNWEFSFYFSTNRKNFQLAFVIQ